MPKALIFGSGGMLGREFAEALAPRFTVIGLRHADCDVTDAARVAEAVRAAQPDVVVNAAALIDVAACERDPAQAFAVNRDGARHIAEAVRRLPGHPTLLQPSTCYVFGDAKESYAVDDVPDPVNVYGKSKAAAEQAVRETLADGAARWLIVRTSWLYSLHRRTFVDLVADAVRSGESFSVVTDLANTVTWTRDLATACSGMLAEYPNPASGVYHLQNDTPRALSKWEIARRCCELLGADPGLLTPATSPSVTGVPRPRSAFLATDPRAPRLRPWDAALQAYFTEKYG